MIRKLALCCSILTLRAQSDLFETSVRPVLVKSCIPCHGPSQQASSLRLDSLEAMLKGGNRGPAIAPGDAAASLLAKSIRHAEAGLNMPMGGSKLKASEIQAIEKWIAQGAPWPATEKPANIGPGDPRYYTKLLREHWAFQPVKATPQATIDQHIRAALAKAGLQHSPGTDRATLIRRLSYVLTGLPPTPLEVDLFVRDQSAKAYERAVDRLLASPHFGEHWARHWMDVMRFAETFGNDWNYEILGASHYRDYLIRAFNNDVPYDQLIREHIAGDLLPKPRINEKERIDESEIGTASFRFGELGHDDCVRFRQIRTDVVDNQIDTLGKAFQGLTIACARCHDHKLDPIPTTDYYSLYGVLTSSRMVTRTVDLADVNASTKQRLSAMKPRIRSEIARLWKEETSRFASDLLAADRAWRSLTPLPEDSPRERVQSILAALETPKPKMEDPLFLWMQAAAHPKAKWSAIAAKFAEEQRARTAFNRDNFRSFGDFAKDGFGGWSADGNGAPTHPSTDGEFAIASTGSKAISGIFPAGIYTHALSERLNAAVRSPVVPKDKKFVSLLLMGGKLGARRTVLDNCMLSEDYTTLDRDTLSWVKIPNRDDQPDLPFYLELATKADNTRIPDRPDRNKFPAEILAGQQSYFGIARAVIHDVDETPRDELTYANKLLQGAAPSTVEQLAERYATTIHAAIEAWEQDRATADDANWLAWLLDRKLLSNSPDASPELRNAIDEYRAIESRIGAARVIQGLADLEAGYNFPVLIGGDAAHPGRVPQRGFLSLLNKGEVKAFGSGRLEVAEMIANAENPLTARVMVNRLWQHMFGRGIVATSDNFGVYGEKPSHPELLDHLAANFVKNGWSMKKLLREIALSETFQQSSKTSVKAQAVDPMNKLLASFPVRRLEAESIRDTLLAVSGRLDRTFYGPSIQPHRDEPRDYRKLHQGPLDGDGRRSIYIKVTRHEGSRFLETFDFPNPNIARGNRDLSNVPPQALTLLNDPFVIEQAGVWAAWIRERDLSTEARIDLMFRTALGRLPTESERARFSGLVKELASRHKVEAAKSQAVWKDVAHAIFNPKELVYVH